MNNRLSLTRQEPSKGAADTHRAPGAPGQAPLAPRYSGGCEPNRWRHHERLQTLVVVHRSRAYCHRLVRHNDPNLNNIIFRDGRAVALMDFDLAKPRLRPVGCRHSCEVVGATAPPGRRPGRAGPAKQ